jgi:GT2 family glycosyltransferase
VSNVLVVLNYNDAETTIKLIKMVMNFNAIDRIVAVDNCSTDDSYSKLLRLQSAKVTILQTPQNGGYAYGNNIGCNYAISRYDPDVIFISNPDVRFEDETITSMEKLLKSDPSIGVVAPLVNRGYNAWNSVGYPGILESFFLLWFSLDKKVLKDKLQKSKKKYEIVKVVEGSFFAISKDAYLKCRGFDERTFLYYEEVILSRRLADTGLREAVLTQIRYDHFHSTSIKKQYGSKMRAYKNYHSSSLVYLNNYVGIGKIKRAVFEICYCLGYLERAVYDSIMGIINSTKGKFK